MTAPKLERPPGRTSTLAEDLAAFVTRASWSDASAEAREALKVRILDALGCALGAVDAAPIAAVRGLAGDLGGNPQCTLLGGLPNAPDRAAFHNGALVRYLDFNDSFLARGETCHPSDNLAAVLAAAEYAGASGRELLTALAVAYQVQCRLSEVAPVRDRGFDHTTHLAYSAAAGVSRALGLDPERTTHALGIAGASRVALRVTRTGELSQWKGLAAPDAAAGAAWAAFLARAGITGPREVFEGNKGFMDSVAGRFAVDWSREDLERVRWTIVKRYDAEVHAQSAIEGVLELRAGGLAPLADRIERIEIDIFDVAYRIIGGGEEGDKTAVRTKEQADHSLPYMVAVALLDGQLLPEQYAPERIARPDVQALLRRVVVRPSEELSRRFPDQHPCRVRFVSRGGAEAAIEKHDYEGFHTRPMRWETVLLKFDRLAAPFAEPLTRARIADVVRHLEDRPVSELCAALAEIHQERRTT